MYLFLKHLHMTLAFLTLFSFALRGVWMMRQSPMLQKGWVKVAPHIIDTLLLVAGLMLAGMLRITPGDHPWLMAKIIALVLYIGLGVVAFRHSNPKVRMASWIAAIIVIIYIISAAFSKSAWGFLIVFG
ncbi:SirB2 family protein [Marinimicrobium sp. ABcell2]|uniref:SirB2 family protein n=1 Tax=Marinimicrobium sp. ABcell2 TaxID=3069751 RepID=UPI0027B48D61|nr:SirB2 family protein [Marinimicrobium sp. ABcell2]MDQ2075318.1 SirB2 family protein [Marinimicrobium sp. ABcell2]